jgi:hypothetical protein
MVPVPNHTGAIRMEPESRWTVPVEAPRELGLGGSFLAAADASTEARWHVQPF